MPTVPMDTHESPLRSVEYLQFPLKLMDITGAQHFFKGWLRETGESPNPEKNLRAERILKKRKFAEAPYIPFFMNSAPMEGTGSPCASGSCTPDMPLVLSSGLPFKGRET